MGLSREADQVAGESAGADSTQVDNALADPGNPLADV